VPPLRVKETYKLHPNRHVTLI